MVLAISFLEAPPPAVPPCGPDLAGLDAPRSRGHLACIVLESAKVAVPIVTGALLLGDRAAAPAGAQLRDAQAWLGERLELVGGDWRAHLVEGAPHEAEVQRAHHVLVVFGHLAERALPQAQPIVAPVGHGLGGEAKLLHGRGQPSMASRRPAAGTGAAAR